MTYDFDADPLVWLEDDADPDVIAWQDEQDALTVKELSNSPHAAGIRRAVDATFADVFGYHAPRRCGGEWLRLDGSLRIGDRVLVDAASVDGPIAVWEPSPDGTKVLVAAGIGIDVEMRVLDPATGVVVRDGVMGAPGNVAWAADSSGFFHNRYRVEMSADGGASMTSEVWFQPLVGDGELQPTAITEGDPISWPVVSREGRYSAVFASRSAARPHWVRRDNDEWQPFLTGETATYKGTFVGDEYWAISDDTSGWYRLVAIPIATWANKATWRELVPAAPGTRLSAVTACGAKVALAVIRDGANELLVLDRDGTVEGEVALPGTGAIGTSGVGHIMSILGDVVLPDGDGCIFVYSSLDYSPAVYRADLITRELELLIAPDHVLDRTVTRHVASGPHGDIDYFELRKPDAPADAPVIVTGYGGFNVPWLPNYSAMAAAWTEAGGAWVHAQLRGGGEKDVAFWEAGRLQNKQGSFDDLIAVVEDLHARGVTTPARTGVQGSSNGGLLAAAVMLQRPDLFGASVPQVPILDLLGCRKDPMTIGAVLADYGNPNDPDDATVLLSYSPYQNVKDGVAYPAVLFDAGDADTMCPPWHSRKTAHRLAAATSSDRRVRLRVRHGSGHNQMTAEEWKERDGEELTFFADELGLR